MEGRWRMISTDASTWRFMVLYSSSVNLPVLFSIFLRYPYFSDIVKQGRLLEYFPVLLAWFSGPPHGIGIISHILGMLECIMVLCVNSSCQGIDGGAYSEYMLLCFLASPSSVSRMPMIPSEYTRIPFFPERFTWYRHSPRWIPSSWMDAA